MRNAFSAMARDDTLLGACYAISGDLGIDPLWMRIAFASLLFASPTLAIGGYFAALTLAIVARLIVPEPLDAVAEAPAEETQAAAGEAQRELPLAA